MRSRHPLPPPLFQLLLRAALAEEVRDLVLGDLQEEFARRAASGLPRRARWWYRVEVLRSLLPAAATRLGFRTPSQRERRKTMTTDVFVGQLRYALRSLIRSPGFTLVSGGTLAVAIGVNAALFSIVQRVLLDPLPYPDGDRVVAVWQQDVSEARRMRVTPGNYTDLQGLGVFESLGAFNGITATLTIDADRTLLRGARVLPSYFRVLRVPPFLGRVFRDEDEASGAPIVMLSHAAWVNWFGSDSSLIGHSIDLDDRAFEVIGVMPPGLYPMNPSISATIPFTDEAQDFWVPLRYSSALYTNRRPHILGVVGRLRDGVSFEQAQVAVRTLGERLAGSEDLNRDQTMLITPLFQEVVGDVARALVILSAAVGLVLLVAASNLAGLFLIRSEARRPELIIRVALGASRRRLVGQLMMESGVLAIGGAVAGLLLGGATLKVIKTLVPVQIPRLADASIDGGVLGFTAALALLSLLLSGLVPAITSTRPRDMTTIRNHARSVAGGRRRQRVQLALVGAQAGLALMLIVAAGLLTRSFRNLVSVETGFVADGVLLQPLPAIRAGGLEQREVMLERLRANLVSLPGVTAAAIAYDHPLQRSWEDGFEIAGRATDPAADGPMASLRPVSAAYFETSRVDLLDGRTFTPGDGFAAPGVAVINEALAHRYLATEDPIGRRVRVPSLARMFGATGVPDSYQIVGVVQNVRFLGPQLAPEPALYIPLSQFPGGGFTAMVRTSGPPESLANSVRATIDEALGSVAVRTAGTLTGALDDFHARPRFNMTLLMAFATIAVVLTSVGVYAMVSRMVALRTKEIGIRMALGAPRAQVVHAVIAETLRPGLIGMAVGIVGALALSRAARTMLFEVSVADPLIYVAAPVLLTGIILVASLLPARRAAAIEPARTLRSEG